ncbi:hypothetical protein CMV_027476, partial [Castanea mollissima]
SVVLRSYRASQQQKFCNSPNLKIPGRKGPLAHLLWKKKRLEKAALFQAAFELYTYCCNSLNLIYQHISISFNEYPRSLTVDIIIFFFKTVDI